MAIDDLLDEHEQGERVRSWLRDNGAGIIGGIVLGLGLIWGWQWWQQQRTGRTMQAGNDFQAAVSALDQGTMDKAKAHVAALPDGQPMPQHLRDARWLLEEYRVSLFAQQLGTREKVSDQRIRKVMART